MNKTLQKRDQNDALYYREDITDTLKVSSIPTTTKVNFRLLAAEIAK